VATDFSLRVIATIKKIPRGKVATYGQIAALAGKPHGARGVAWLLNSSSRAHGLPWQRVINSQGRISFPLYSEAYLRQRGLLEREGVEFVDGGAVDLKTCQWKVRSGLPVRQKKSRRKAKVSPKSPNRQLGALKSTKRSSSAVRAITMQSATRRSRR
jgi:methylated-DNA-protein-cysteine methyltransferase-like protein